MKTKTVTRYCCDFCPKTGAAKHRIREHEKTCAMNPDRVCVQCATKDSKPFKELLQAIGVRSASSRDDENDAFEAIVKLGGITNCGWCVVAALRQGGFADTYAQAMRYLNDDDSLET